MCVFVSRPMKHVIFLKKKVRPLGLLVFFWKTHIPDNKSTQIVEDFACEVKNLIHLFKISDFSIFPFFHFLHFSLFFHFFIFHFLFFSCSFFDCFSSSFSFLLFFVFPLFSSSLSFFSFCQSSEQTPKTRKNHRKGPIVKMTISCVKIRFLGLGGQGCWEWPI